MNFQAIFAAYKRDVSSRPDESSFLKHDFLKQLSQMWTSALEESKIGKMHSIFNETAHTSVSFQQAVNSI